MGLCQADGIVIQGRAQLAQSGPRLGSSRVKRERLFEPGASLANQAGLTAKLTESLVKQGVSGESALPYPFVLAACLLEPAGDLLGAGEVARSFGFVARVFEQVPPSEERLMSVWPQLQNALERRGRVFPAAQCFFEPASIKPPGRGGILTLGLWTKRFVEVDRLAQDDPAFGQGESAGGVVRQGVRPLLRGAAMPRRHVPDKARYKPQARRKNGSSGVWLTNSSSSGAIPRTSSLVPERFENQIHEHARVVLDTLDLPEERLSLPRCAAAC